MSANNEGTHRSNLRARLPRGLKKRLKFARVAAYEAFGSTRFSYPAINNLDRQVLPLLPEYGVFLEVGANDGYSQSNTYYLERHRCWDGVLIEAIPKLFNLCCAFRKTAICLHAACVDIEDKRKRVPIRDSDLTSRLGQEDSSAILVPAATISSLIDKTPFSEFDFMSIDVEESEIELLKGLDFDRHTPKWMLVETHQLDLVRGICMPHMQLHSQLSHHDYLFRAT